MIVIYSIFKISSCDMSSITAKLHENLVSGFRELAITVTVVYLNLVKYLSSKEALLKKLSSYEHAHLHSMSFPNTKFHEILLSSFKSIAVAICFSSIFNFGQIKSEEKIPANMRIYTQCPSWKQSFTKFCWAVSNQLRWQKKKTPPKQTIKHTRSNGVT